jgi:uncharacterized protein
MCVHACSYSVLDCWLQEFKGPPLRSGDALHLAMAKRQNLTIASADQGLAKAAEALGLPCHLIT